MASTQVATSSGTSSPSCGSIISAYTKLETDLACNCTLSPALVVTGLETALDLNGHRISCGDPSNVGSVGIRVEGESNEILGPGDVVGAYDGIVLGGNGGHTISKVSVYDIGNEGIGVVSDSNLIDQTDVHVIGGVGVHLEGNNNNVTNNNVTNCSNHLISVLGSFNLIEHNLLNHTTSGHGIEISYSMENRMLYNVITQTFGSGIRISSGQDHDIMYNDINRVGGSAVLVGSVVNANIAYNTIHNNDFYGVRIATLAQYVVVEHNVITGNLIFGIDGSGCNQCHYNGNTVSNGGIGIFISDCAGSILSGNHVTNNTHYGVQIDPRSSYTILTGNDIRYNGERDINDKGVDTLLMGDNYIESWCQDYSTECAS